MQRHDSQRGSDHVGDASGDHQQHGQDHRCCAPSKPTSNLRVQRVVRQGWAFLPHVMVQGKPKKAHQQTKAHDGAEGIPMMPIHFAIPA